MNPFEMNEEEMDRTILGGMADELHYKISDYIVRYNKPKFRIEIIQIIEKGILGVKADSPKR